MQSLEVWTVLLFFGIGMELLVNFEIYFLLTYEYFQTGFIAGEYNQPGEVPSPRSILTGHEASISALCVSAEHGLVVSGCEDGVILIHTTSSDLLRRIRGHGIVTQLSMSRECILLSLFDSKRMVTYSATAKKLDEVLVDDKWVLN